MMKEFYRFKFIDSTWRDICSHILLSETSGQCATEDVLEDSLATISERFTIEI